jgi:hypothetical protein
MYGLVGIDFRGVKRRWAIGWYVPSFEQEETRAGRKIVHAKD